MTYLERYLEGEQAAVWAELTALGDEVRRRAIRGDAADVARETMRRARKNIEILIPRLRELGVKFKDKQPFTGPNRKISDQIRTLEKTLGGPIPFSLAAWWEQVGSVSFLGAHPSLYRTPSDPLVFAPIEYAIDLAANWADSPKGDELPPPPGAWKGSVEAWRRSLRAEGLSEAETEEKLAPTIAEFEAQDREYEAIAQSPPDPRFRFDFAPDELVKADVTGASYNALLPNFAVDFVLEGAAGNPLFVTYLRESFQGGGFRAWSGTPKERDFLTQGLLPL